MNSRRSALGVLCSLVLVGLNIGFGLTYVVEAGMAGYINGPAHLWYWCVIDISFSTLMLTKILVRLFQNDLTINVVSKAKEENTIVAVAIVKHSTLLNKVLILASLGMTIWGCVIYSQINGLNVYPEHIWTWFQVVFIFALSIWSCIGCVLCCNAIFPDVKETTKTANDPLVV
jgi:hypothetical protein